MIRIYTSLDDELHARFVKYNEEHPARKIVLKDILRAALDETLAAEGY